MVYGDSALLINQLNKDWSCSSEKVDAYYAEIRKLEGKVYGIEYHHMVRDQNQLADQLSKIGSSCTAVPPGGFVQDLLTPSIKEDKEVVEVPPHRAVGTHGTFTGRRLEGIVHQIPLQRRNTRRQNRIRTTNSPK